MISKELLLELAEEAGFIVDYESSVYQPKCISGAGLIDDKLMKFAELVTEHVRSGA